MSEQEYWFCKWCATMFYGAVPSGELCPDCCEAVLKKSTGDSDRQGHYRITDEGTVWSTADDADGSRSY